MPRALCTGVLLLAAILLMPALLALLPPSAGAHNPQDEVLQQVGVDERLGQPVPTGLRFRDPTGRTVRLADYFTGGPAIVTLNYYACPTLCPLVFRNLADSVRQLGDLKLGKDFRIVTVSINPDEAPALARDKSQATYAMLGGLTEPENRWPFLMGDQSAIENLAQSVGVRYSRQGKNDFAHPNVLVVVTPGGRISRYLYGLEVRPRDLKLALVEAADGRIGGSRLSNSLLLYCFHYDPVGKKYVLFASRLMTVSMLGVLAVTAAMLILLWRREKRGGAA